MLGFLHDVVYPALKFNGFGLIDEMLLINQVVVGVFFAISGHHKIFIPSRHKQLVSTLEACGIPHVWFCQWFVPWVELLSGLGVVTGFFAWISSVGMMCILLIALLTDGPRRIREFQPIDRADWLDDCLYLSETTYLVMAAFVSFAGTSSYSLHWYLLSFAPGF